MNSLPTPRILWMTDEFPFWGIEIRVLPLVFKAWYRCSFCGEFVFVRLIEGNAKGKIKCPHCKEKNTIRVRRLNEEWCEANKHIDA